MATTRPTVQTATSLQRLRRFGQYVRDLIGSSARKAPLSFFLVAIVWVLGLGLSATFDPQRESPARSVFLISDMLPQHPWSIALSFLWAPTHALLLWSTILLLTLGVFAERNLGSWRYAATLIVGHLVGVIGGISTFRLLTPLLPEWANSAVRDYFGGPLLGIVCATLTATAMISTLWRRRIRLGVTILLITVALFQGSLVSFTFLCAAAIGLVLSIWWVKAEVRTNSPTASIRERRILISLITSAVAIAPPIAALSGTAYGPFAVIGSVFTGVRSHNPRIVNEVCSLLGTARECTAVPASHSIGVLAFLIPLIPMIIMLVCATGLRLGRRAGLWGTIAVQVWMMLIALTVMLQVLGRAEDGAANAVPMSATVTLDLVVPFLVPLSVIVLLVRTRKLFQIRVNGTVSLRLWADALTTALVSFALYVGLGTLLRIQFKDAPGAATFAKDFYTRLIPLGEGLTTTLDVTPQGLAAKFLYDGITVLFWVSIILILLKALKFNPPEINANSTAKARQLVKQYGRHSLSWMTLWPNNYYWFSSKDDAVVAYRSVANVALTVGDPICAPERLSAVLSEFNEYCAVVGLSPCLYSVAPATQEVALAHGWYSAKVAEETVLPLGAQDFKGKQFQDIRTAMNRAQRDGLRIEWCRYETAPLALTNQINAISEAWVADKKLPELGFTLGALEELRDPEVLCQLVIDEEQTVHAIASWLPVHENGEIVGWVLDFMRRHPDGFRSSIEYLIGQAVLHFQAENHRFVSLSGAPLASADKNDTQNNSLDRVLDWLGRTMEPVYGFRSLFNFKAKFMPTYVPLSMCYTNPAALPAIGQAITKAYAPDATLADLVTVAAITRKG